jgi:hypothetical protein
VISQPAAPPPPLPPTALATPAMAKSADPRHNPSGLNPGRGDER